MIVLGGDGSGTSSTPVVDAESISRLRDDAQLALDRYIADRHHHRRAPAVQPSFRLGQLLLLLASLRAVSEDTIEELYFRFTLGDVSVARILADMYASADL